MFTIERAQVKLTFSGLVLGSLPKDLTALKYVNEQRKKVSADPIPEESVEELVGDETEQEERQKCIFRRKEDIPAVDEHHIKGIIREVFKKQGYGRKYRGIWMAIHTQPYLISFSKIENIVEEIRAFRVMGAQGPRSIVAVHEAVLNSELEFIIELHIPADVSKKERDEKWNISLIKDALIYAGRYIGFGAGRLKSGIEHPYGLFAVDYFQEL